MKLQVIYEDEYILACHKPAGVATQTASLRQQDMVTLMQNYRRRKGEEPYIGLLQRLDQPVEGIVIAAKDPKTAADLSRQLQAHTITKEYLALIPKDVISEKGVLEDWLVKDAKTNTSRAVKEKQPNVKKARLTYEILTLDKAKEKGIELSAIPDGYTAALVRLDTGRHHQIRVQFASRGCPLYGDEKYGGTKIPDSKGIGLCAVRIVLQHPNTKKPLELTANPDWK